MALTGRAFAWTNLAFRFAQHVLLRMPKRALFGDRDYDRFTGAVSREGYLPLAPDERAAFPAFMRCVHCGLCSISCPSLRAAPASAWSDAWTFVAGPSRSIDRATIVAADITPCSACGDCAAACPTGVPIPQLAALIKRLDSLQQANGSP